MLARPNKFLPMIANMKKKIISSIPSEPSDPAESNSVSKMICN